MNKRLIYILGILFILTTYKVEAQEISSADIENNSYVIGSVLYTSDTILSTRHIMLASRTVPGFSVEDMIIYYKTPRGKWIEGLSGEQITVPKTFDISFIDVENCDEPAGIGYTYAEYGSTFVENNTYVIGDVMFSSNTVLSTRHIMYAAKTISSDKLKDMIIYYRTPRGKWIEGLSGNPITPPETFSIGFSDSKKILDVYFDGNGGENEFNHKRVVEGQAFGEMPTSTRKGYKFLGWYTKKSESPKIESTTEYPTSQESITLYAHWDANEYTITFNTNGSELSLENKKIKYDSEFGTLPAPTKDGHTFDGWYKKDGTKIETNSKYNQTENITLYAKWSINKYLITFDANEGTVTPTTKEITYNTKYGELPIPTRENYDFIGWYTEKEVGTKIEEANIYNLTTDSTIFAHWKSLKYTIFFDTNGGKINILSKEVIYNKEYGELPTPTKEGYNFDGWYTATENKIDPNNKHNYYTDITLYAKWTPNEYTVTFDPNGGTVSLLNKTVKYEMSYGELPIPTKDEHVFIGWYTEKDNGIRIESTSLYSISLNSTLYAHWRSETLADQVSLGDYVVMTPSQDSYLISKDSTGAQNDITIKPNELSLWRVIKKNEDGTVDVISEYVSSENVQFEGVTGYANYVGVLNDIASQYENNKYTTKSGIIGYSNQTEHIVDLSYITDYEKNWKLDTGVKELCDDNLGYLCNSQEPLGGGDVMYYDDIEMVNEVLGTLKASKINSNNQPVQYYIGSRNITSFQLYGENRTYEMQIRTISNNETYDLYSNTIYYLKESGVTNLSYTEGSIRPILTLKSNIKITHGTGKQSKPYAFNNEEYTIWFNANGGTVDIESKEITYGTEYGELPIAQKEGYDFLGWYDAAPEGTKIESSNIYSLDEDCILHAHWAPHDYTISFDANEGSVDINEKQVTYKKEYGELPIPTKDGYVFIGWYTEKDGGTLVEPDTQLLNAYNHTLYAHWKVYKIGENLEVGDYIYMKPTSNEYNVSKDLTGYEENQKIDPSYLNRWQVIKINDDGSIDCVSELSSPERIYFNGLTGYANYIGTLNLIAEQYSNVEYVKSTRYIGYKNQTEFIANLNKIEQNTKPWTNEEVVENEMLGSGDNNYVDDLDLVKNASGYYSSPGDAGPEGYWIASRSYNINDSDWSFAGKYLKIKPQTTAYGKLEEYIISGDENNTFIEYTNGISNTNSKANQLKVIITIKPDVEITKFNNFGIYDGTGDHSVYLLEKDSLVEFKCDASIDNNSINNCISYYKKVVTPNQIYGYLPSPTENGYIKDGYHFVGWSEDKEGLNKVDSTTIFNNNENTTLYGQWSPNEYTITFDPNEGIVETENKTIKYLSQYGELPIATRDGYIFKGWYTDKDGGIKIENTSIYTNIIDTTLYAQWE